MEIMVGLYIVGITLIMGYLFIRYPIIKVIPTISWLACILLELL